MPQPAMHKDVTINSKTYRVHRLPARDGSWISILLTGKIREEVSRSTAATLSGARGAKAVKAKQKEADAEAAKLSYEAGMMMTATFLIANLTRTELADVQTACMSRVSRMEELAGAMQEIPVFDGSMWYDDGLEFDAPAVLELTKQSLALNIAPFFPAPASN